MAFSFFGGVHPKENKHYAEERSVQAFPAPDLVVIPMSQHIGAPCKPLVKKNDIVTKGQKIGDNQGLCVPVHASVSGKVKAVEARAHTNGSTVMSVVIENDHQDTLCPEIQPRTQAEVDALTAEELVNIIREAGIVGMGGASFPTHVKLSGAIGKADTIIVNAGECEPYITADDRLCQELPEEVVQGLMIGMKILGLKEGHIGIEDNKPKAAAALKNAAIGTGVVVDVLPAKYPQGAAAKLSDVDENIHAFQEGYDTVLGERGVTVSGGQKQRISIARALMKDSPVLILDDSVSAVDTKTEKAILANLRATRAGKTTILIAHRISTIEGMDKILFLDEGRLVDAGTHQELLARCPDYRKMVELQKLEEEGGADHA